MTDIDRMPWQVRILFHDGLIHPIAAVLWAMRLDRAANWLHNLTVPMFCSTCRQRFDAAICPNCGGELR